MLIKNVPVDPKRVKAGPEDGLKEGEFIVYPSTFTREPDAYGDVVAKGAFAETLDTWRESGNVLPGLWGHRMDDPDYFIASGLDYGEDDHGWWVKGKFDLEAPKAAQTYRLVKGRRVSQLSFAYDTLEEGAVEVEAGKKANELRKLNVYEFSFVPIGANQDTSVVAVKAACDALASGVKAGRAISAKNESELRKAHDAIGNVLAALGKDDEEEDPEPKASGDAEAKSGASGEEPSEAKSSVPAEEPKRGPSARVQVELQLLALTH